MAGYSKIYCIGGLGGFEGADGINPIDFQIWVGDGERRWFEVHYFNDKIKPIGKLRTIIPESPDHPDGLLDACIAFSPEYFHVCAALEAVREKLQSQDRLDFNLEKRRIPREWVALREQARPLFRDLIIFEAELEPLQRGD